MMDEDKDYRKALDLSFFYLRFRPRSIKEVRDYLHKKAEKFKLSDGAIERVIIRLQELKFVNDKDFTAWYVDQRTRSKPKGKHILKMELYKHGVPRDIVDDFFLDTELDEDAMAYDALGRKWRSLAALEPKKRFERAAGFLLRRGYSFDIAKKTIARIEAER